MCHHCREIAHEQLEDAQDGGAQDMDEVGVVQLLCQELGRLASQTVGEMRMIVV